MLSLGIALLVTFVTVTALVSWAAYETQVFAIVSCNGDCYMIPVLEPTVRLGVIAGAVAVLIVVAGWALWHNWRDTDR